MLINDIEYPEELIEAIRNNNLVIFAGAGVSMGEPTNLPSFMKLSEKIAGLTHIYKSNGEAEEQYLGRVKTCGHNVQKSVCEMLNEKNLKPNRYHKTLIELFPGNNIRIVTTNYDLMFEKSLGGENKVDVYSYPALPYGDKINGVIHLHGDVLNYEDIVLTDSDFGKAYMYYGNATNFLKQLFDSNYIVLFVGYSYSDVVLKYFTRSLPVLSNNKRFIFAYKSQAEEFTSIGLTPIVYEDGNYEQIYRSLSILSEIVNRDENEWQVRIYEIAESTPNKLNSEFNYEVKQILKNIYYHNKFFNVIRGRKWAEYLFEQGYFDNIFSTGALNDFDSKKIEWLSNNIITKELDLFIKFCYDKNFILSNSLQNEIVDKICRSYQDIQFNKIKTLVNLINFKKIHNHYLVKLMDICYKYSPKLDLEASRIISDSLVFELKRNSMLINDRLEINFYRSEYEISSLWEGYKKFDDKYNIEILNILSNRLSKLNKFDNIGISVEKFYFYSFYQEEKEYLSELDLFIGILSDLLLGLDEEYKEYWLKKHIHSNMVILVRSALFIFRTLNSYSAKRKLEILRENNIKIFTLELREDLFMLYSDIFPKLEDVEKKKFINEIMKEEKLSDNYDDETYYYQKYNLLNWLNRFDKNNNEIKDNINLILNKYSYFKPRTNPQKSFGPTTTRWGDAPLPFSEKDIVDNLDCLYNKLLTYSGDGLKEATRATLVNTIQNICHKNSDFRIKLITKLSEDKNFDSDLWRGIIKSLEDLDIEDKELRKIYNQIFVKPIIKNYHYELSSIIYSYVNTKNREIINNEILSFLYEKNLSLWEHATDCKFDSLNYMEKALNSSRGLIALSTVNIISFSIRNTGEKRLEAKYKEFLENMLHEKNSDDALVILLGNSSFFFSLDKKWCSKYILENFNPEDKKIFNIAWEGFSYQSYLYRDFALEMEPIFHESIKSLNLIREIELRKRLISLYATLMLNISDNPIKDYIPNIFSTNASIEIIQRFYFELEKHVKAVDKNRKKEIFDKWIIEFLLNRVNNYPTLITDEEKNLILDFILNFSGNLEKISLIFEELDKKFNISTRLIDCIYYEEINSDNSSIICRVLITVTNQIKRNTQQAIPTYIENELFEIYQKLSKNKCEIEKLEKNLKLINVLN